MKDENKLYRIGQKIDDHDWDKDGCIWGHIMEWVEKAYLLGRNSKQEEYEQQYS